MKRIIIPIALVLCLAVGTMMWPVVARVKENGRGASVQSQLRQQIFYGASMKGTPQWTKKAATFNNGKRTSAAIFDRATKVETFRLFRTSPDEAAKTSMRGFEVFAQGPTLDGKFGQRLGAVLLRPESYVLPGQGTTACAFEPGVAFRVWSGATSVDAILCFGCNQLGVVENDPKVPERNIGGRLNDRMNVLGDFGPARVELLTLTKEAFASDDAVQSIR